MKTNLLKYSLWIAVILLLPGLILCSCDLNSLPPMYGTTAQTTSTVTPDGESRETDPTEPEDTTVHDTLSDTETVPDKTPSDTSEAPIETETTPDCEAPTQTQSPDGCSHTPASIPAIRPTCTESGREEGSVCGDCGEVLNPPASLPATGHSYSEAFGYKCEFCGNQAECPAPILNHTGELALAWGEVIKLTWRYDGDPAFSVVCMVTALDQNGQPKDLWETWKAESAYLRPCKLDGETFTLRVYACYAANGEPVSATQSHSNELTVTVSVRVALESPGFVTGNQITAIPERDVTVAWGAVTETGSRVVYDVTLLSPDGETQILYEGLDETVCTVPESLLSTEGSYSLQVVARDENEAFRDSPPAALTILVTPPPAVGEQDFENPARYASDYFYNYLATQEKAAGLQGFYRLMDAALSDFHISRKTADTVEVSGGRIYSYAVKLNFAMFGLTRDEAAAVRILYLYDHPLYYWVSSSYVYNNTSLYVCVEDEYANGKARAEANQLVYDGVAHMAESVIDVTSPYRIALAYYETLLARADYAYEDDGTTPQDDPWAHSIIGVFDPDRNAVVCEGFAEAYSLLLNYHGVENIPVVGESRGVGHMWNLVRLDNGGWYWCDVTWDDHTYSPLGTDYKYFCVTDTQDVLFYHYRDGTKSGYSYSFGEPAAFLDDHTVNWWLDGTIAMSSALPVRAEAPFNTDGLELRETFTADGMTYAKTGFGTVQLVDMGSRRSVTVPETVTHEGITYTVASIGLISEEGFYVTGRMLPLFASSVYIPKTVSYIWDDALSGFLVNITVDPENPWYTSQSGTVKPKS